MDEVPYGCRACGFKAGRLADLESHILTKTHQLNAKDRPGEEILIKKRGRAAILLSKFKVLSVKASQKIWTERKKKNQESNTDEEQLKAILETVSLTQEQQDLLKKMSQQLKKQSTGIQ